MPTETEGLRAKSDYMDSLTTDDLAIASGASSDVIAHLSEVGLLLPVDNDGRHPLSNVSRIRLLLAYEGMGVSLDTFREGVRSGLALAFVDELMPSPARLLPETYGQLAARINAPPSLVKAIRNTLGTADASDEEHVRDDDAAIFQLAARVNGLGANEEQLARILRMIAESVRRIVRVQRDFIDEVLIMPKIASGASEAAVLQSTTPARHEFRMVGAELTTLLLRRFVDDAIFQSIVELGERALQRAGMVRTRPTTIPAIAFVDVSGYTKIAETAGDEAAAGTAARFALLVDDGSIDFGGRLC